MRDLTPAERLDFQRNALLGLLLALFVALVVLGGIALLLRPRLTLPDYEYTQVIVQPPKPTFCPGETFAITYRIRINKVPTVLMVVETFFSEQAGGTVVFDDHPYYTVHTIARTVTRTIQVHVPRLPAGRYQFRQGAQAFDSPPSAFYVPFVIGGGCL